MKTYNEYYKEISKKLENKKYNNTEFWKHVDVLGTIKGTYLFPSKNNINSKNDDGMYLNSTYVKNSKYVILFYMLFQHLIDYCQENNLSNISHVQISVKKIIDGTNYFYEPKLEIFSEEEMINNSEIEECYINDFCEIIDKFITDNFYDIPLEVNYLFFALDDIEYSYEKGEWDPYTEGTLFFCNDSNGDIMEAYAQCI